jgi:hypothetical protein
MTDFPLQTGCSADFAIGLSVRWPPDGVGVAVVVLLACGMEVDPPPPPGGAACVPACWRGAAGGHRRASL